jgi:hypothetical protein
MSENRACASFLGVHVAERVLSHIFKDVTRMHYGNPGYDFICRHGYKVDVKSSCRRTHSENRADNWMFSINKNRVADYFLCLAFDSRESLNPEHVWLIPADNINDRMGVGISTSTIHKWNEFEQPIDQVVTCCDMMRVTT